MTTVPVAILGQARAGGLHALDWIVLAAYAGLLSAIGAWASRRASRGAGDFFLAGRRMPAWAVACSVVATTTSAATFIGAPQEAYDGDLRYLSTMIGQVLAVLLVAWVFIPAYYRHGVTTVYDLLDRRFGPTARAGASGAFMLGRVLASGARVFVAAIPASLLLFGDKQPWQLAAAIALVTAAAVLTAVRGGIRSVIWTDVLQTAVLFGSAGAAVAVLLWKIPAGPAEIVAALRAPAPGEPSKLTALRLGIDPARPGLGVSVADTYTLVTAVCGFSLLHLAAYGTDHDLTQRMLTCRSAVRGGASALGALALTIPMTALFMGVGLLLFVFYRRPDLMGAYASAAPADSTDVFLRFIVDHMPTGVVGLMLAGLLAVGVGSLNSALGAMSATFVNDFYRPARPGLGEAHYVRVGRWAVAGWGAVLAAFACACIAWYSPRDSTLIRFVLGVMTFAYAGLLGVFLTALLTRRGSEASAVAALVAGFAAVLLLQPGVWAWWTSLSPLTAATPGDPGDWRLGEVKVSFPWRLTIAAGLAFAVCASVRGPARAEAAT